MDDLIFSPSLSAHSALNKERRARRDHRFAIQNSPTLVHGGPASFQRCHISLGYPVYGRAQ